MLSKDEKRASDKGRPGTLMGELLRYYWMPIAAVAEPGGQPHQARAPDVAEYLVL